MIKKILISAVLFLSSLSSINSQIAVTQSANGTSVQDILENNFIGNGVTISNASFNNQANLNSNQLGTFINNGDTIAPNVALKKGLVLVTGSVTDAGAGNSAGTESSTSSPVSNNYTIAQPLYDLLKKQGNNSSMNDIGSLKFDFEASGDEVSFRYVFASEEYPNYVCSNYNDAFGFFISGPFEDDGVTPTPGAPHSYNWENIAIIPNSNPEVPVTLIP